MQRVPRYALLIKELLKFTPPEHQDKPYLEEALKELGSATSHIDDTINQRKNHEQIIELQTLFVDDVHLTSPGRQLLHSGYLKRITRRRHIIMYMFHLFSDTLTYSSNVAGTKKLKLHNAIDLATTTIEALSVTAATDLGVPPEFSSYAMNLLNASKSFVIYTDNDKDRDEWFNFISSAITKLAAGKAIEAKKMWEPDDTSDSCTICMAEFTVLNRRHHCRQCGSLVCNNCSLGRRVIDGTTKVERVCSRCEHLIGMKDHSDALHLHIHD